jgi:hypothetical protein
MKAIEGRIRFGKIIWCIIFVFLIPALAFAIPQIMSYQGKLNDKSGVPVSGSVNMTFTIYNVKEGGQGLWTEDWSGVNGVNVSNGIFSIALGSHNAFPSDLFNSDSLYLGIRVGSDAEMTPRQQIVSGSYAFKSKTVEYNVPIGTILGWAKNLTGVPSLPDGWVECNGQILSDTESVLNNQLVPNLNGNDGGTNYFLRGSSVPGTGGSLTHSHKTAEINDSGSHAGSDLGFGTFTASGSYCNVGYSSSYCSSGNKTRRFTETVSLEPPFYNVVWIMKVK